jgi:hypothetical protein
MAARGGKTVGVNDPAVSPHVKTWIMQNGIMVCGITSEGAVKDVQDNWNSPFEGEAVGSKFAKTGGVIQSGLIEDTVGIGAGSGQTSISLIQSRQVWEGAQPHSFTLPIWFYALQDAYSEVSLALRYLEEFRSPELNNATPFGRIPQPVTIKIGKRAIYPNCVIESLSEPLDTQVDKNGYPVTCMVNLQVQTKQIINRSQVASHYG